MAQQDGLESLTALEYRLRRLEYCVTGGNPAVATPTIQGKNQTLRVRLARLERNLQEYIARSQAAQELLQIC